LTIATINTFRHVNIVDGRTPSTVLAFFHFNGNGLGGTGGFAQFAANASFIATGVTPEGVFSPKSGTQISLFVGIIDGRLGL